MRIYEKLTEDTATVQEGFDPAAMEKPGETPLKINFFHFSVEMPAQDKNISSQGFRSRRVWSELRPVSFKTTYRVIHSVKETFYFSNLQLLLTEILKQ